MKLFALAAAGLALLSIPLAQAQTGSAGSISIDTSNSSDWKISNGVLTVDWMPNDGRIFSMHWAAFPTQELIDQTNRNHAGAKGFYMDNVGPGSGTRTNDYHLDPNGRYIDWWMTVASSSTSAFTWSQHYILFADDPGVHIYYTLDHKPGDPAGGIGQIQWVLRSDLAQFPNTYSVNTGLGELVGTHVPLPDAVLFGNKDAGRNVQDATIDLHGLNLPADFRREFYTKYDYSSYEYMHKAEGVYGSTMAAWMVVPSQESLTGGPTKQDLIFTGNLLIMEAYSNHLDNQMSYQVTTGDTMHRLYGPFYLHFNAFNGDHASPPSLYREAIAAAEGFKPAYDSETVLLQSGYVPSSARGNVNVMVNGAKDLNLNQAWAVLSDEGTNMQYSHAGREYWAGIDPGGMASFHAVAPGRYRLTIYVLGKWGELRRDGVVVRPDAPTNIALDFTPENFGSEGPVWTIGTADRSSHEFLHGQIANPVDLDSQYQDEYTNRQGNSAQDDREFWGNWNYWADFASNLGAVEYYATPVGSTAATNDLMKWNYNQWHAFNPHLFAAIYNPADLTNDGYKYICPVYVGNCATAAVPDWRVHFATTDDQQQGGQYVALSVGLAATESDLTISLNGQPLTWHGYGHKNSDAMVRSGLSGTYQWVVFQWNTSALKAAGQENVLTFHVNRTYGVEYDALRLEIGDRSANPAVTGWNDYEFVDASGYTPANDELKNQ